MAAKILIVDDEALILSAVERALTKVGHTIIKAKSLAELESVLENGPFDLLITDVNIKGDSVDAVTARVKEGSPAVRVLRMSGALNKHNFPEFIEKPFSIHTLRSRVAAILDKSPEPTL